MHTALTLKDMKGKVDVSQIDPKRIYTLAEIASLRLMPWAKNGRTIRKILDADRIGPNFLKVGVSGTGNRKRYLIPGNPLKSYLKHFGPSLMALVRKPNKYGKKSNNARSKGARGSTGKD